MWDNSLRFEDQYITDDKDGQARPNDWQNSEAQKWYKSIATDSSIFTQREQAAFLAVEKNDQSEETLYGITWGTSSLSENDKIFFLSARELTDYVADYSGASELAVTGQNTDYYNTNWWLRSPSGIEDREGMAGWIRNINAVDIAEVDMVA